MACVGRDRARDNLQLEQDHPVVMLHIHNGQLDREITSVRVELGTYVASSLVCPAPRIHAMPPTPVRVRDLDLSPELVTGLSTIPPPVPPSLSSSPL